MKGVLRNNWKELSEAASHEQDPAKLLELVELLNQALEEREREMKREPSLYSASFYQDGSSVLGVARPTPLPCSAGV